PRCGRMHHGLLATARKQVISEQPSLPDGKEGCRCAARLERFSCITAGRGSSPPRRGGFAGWFPPRRGVNFPPPPPPGPPPSPLGSAGAHPPPFSPPSGLSPVSHRS